MPCHLSAQLSATAYYPRQPPQWPMTMAEGMQHGQMHTRCAIFPFFLVVVYIINSAIETEVRRDVPPSPHHLTLIQCDRGDRPCSTPFRRNLSVPFCSDMSLSLQCLHLLCLPLF